jgi:hypothetical protein
MASSAASVMGFVIGKLRAILTIKYKLAIDNDPSASIIIRVTTLFIWHI